MTEGETRVKESLEKYGGGDKTQVHKQSVCEVVSSSVYSLCRLPTQGEANEL